MPATGSDDGETQLEPPEAGAEFSVYLKSAGSYDAAKDVVYSYRCAGYANGTAPCTAHGIGADTVENLLLSTVQRLSQFVLADEAGFVRELQSKWLEKQECKPEKSKSELKRLQKKYDELGARIRGLYENLVDGLLPERQYKQLMKQYDDEQAEEEVKMEQLKSELDEAAVKPLETEKFIALIKKYKNPAEITDTMLRDLVDKIVVHEGTGEGVNRVQQVDIYFNFVGQVNIAYTEAELAEQQAKREQIAAERLARQREREKGYREKRKAKKIAENGGVAVPKKVCPCCGEEFTPTSNHQVFCTPNCRYVYAQNEKKAAREAERGDHYYRQRNCMVCGKLFWPDGPSAKVCSEDCRLEKKRRESRAAYARQKQEQSVQQVAV